MRHNRRLIQCDTHDELAAAIIRERPRATHDVPTGSCLTEALWPEPLSDADQVESVPS